jgi:hypothetical protein
MWTKILPPDFVTRFGFLSLDQFDFSNRFFERTLHWALSRRFGLAVPLAVR